MTQSTLELINSYYEAFNAGDMDAFLNLLDENVIHDINQGGCQTGKAVFKKFMDHMNQCYKEQLTNIIIMTSTDGNYASAKFQVEGTYLNTDSGFPTAKQQKYALPAGSFFDVKNGKITRVTTYYNLPDWINQVSEK
jgi:steroid delta-isomerase-like uncharacterized protein